MACDSNTLFMAHFNEADGSTTPVDSSTYARTITCVGNAQVDTAWAPSLTGATGSFLLDGSGDWGTLADAPEWDRGAGEWTYEFRMKFNSVGACSIMLRDEGVYQWRFMISGGKLRFINGAGNWDLVGATTISNGVEYHVAGVRSGNTISLYLNGTKDVADATYSGTLPASTAGITIGGDVNVGSAPMNGWLAEIRFSDIARYTGNFTPSTSQFCLSGAKNYTLLGVG